jgi:hypothetical protein
MDAYFAHSSPEACERLLPGRAVAVSDEGQLAQRVTVFAGRSYRRWGTQICVTMVLGYEDDDASAAKGSRGVLQ